MRYSRMSKCFSAHEQYELVEVFGNSPPTPARNREVTGRNNGARKMAHADVLRTRATRVQCLVCRALCSNYHPPSSNVSVGVGRCTKTRQITTSPLFTKLCIILPSTHPSVVALLGTHFTSVVSAQAQSHLEGAGMPRRVREWAWYSAHHRQRLSGIPCLGSSFGARCPDVRCEG